jgi:hypothetical protein
MDGDVVVQGWEGVGYGGEFCGVCEGRRHFEKLKLGF